MKENFQNERLLETGIVKDELKFWLSEKKTLEEIRENLNRIHLIKIPIEKLKDLIELIK